MRLFQNQLLTRWHKEGNPDLETITENQIKSGKPVCLHTDVGRRKHKEPINTANLWEPRSNYRTTNPARDIKHHMEDNTTN